MWLGGWVSYVVGMNFVERCLRRCVVLLGLVSLVGLWGVPVLAAPAVTGFELVASKSSVSVVAGQSVVVNVTVQRGARFVGVIDVVLSSNIPGVVLSRRTVGSTLEVGISVPAGVVAQSGEVLVVGTSKSRSSGVRIGLTVRVPAPDFDLVRDGADPLVLDQGGTVTFTVTVIPRNGYTGTPKFGPRSATPHFLWKGAIRTGPNTFAVTIGAELVQRTGTWQWALSVSSGSVSTGDRIDKEFPLTFFIPNRTGFRLQLYGPVSITRGSIATVNVYVVPESPANNTSGQLTIENHWNSQLFVPTIDVPPTGTFQLINIVANDANTGFGTGNVEVSARLTMPSGISVTSRLEIPVV
jgi:hypothetical protein